jgi:hypothetical protein
MLARVGRLAIVLGAMLALKLAARFTLIGVFTDRAIQFFAIVDAAVIILAAPWAAAAAPKPARADAWLRAVRTAATLTLGLWAMNLALQFPLTLARSNDALEAVLRLLTAGLANAVLAGPVGAVGLFVLASGLAWGWLMLRLPRPKPDKLARKQTDRRSAAREDQPNRNVPRPPGSPQLRVRKGPHR